MSKTPVKPLDLQFAKYNQIHDQPFNRTLTFIYIPLILFGFLGMVWSLPFPVLGFLGKYNTYINWFTLVFGLLMYYYYKKSPVLTYGVLLAFFFFSFFIVGLEKAHTNYGWPQMGIVCLIVLVLGLILQFFGSKTDREKLSPFQNIKFLVLGPLWALHFIFKKAGINY